MHEEQLLIECACIQDTREASAPRTWEEGRGVSRSALKKTGADKEEKETTLSKEASAGDVLELDSTTNSKLQENMRVTWAGEANDKRRGGGGGEVETKTPTHPYRLPAAPRARRLSN